MLGRLFGRKREAEAPAPECGCVVWDRAQLAEYVSEKAGFDAIGKAAEHVERVMVLQNDIGRPTYVVEVSADLGTEDIAAIKAGMVCAGVSCLLVPTNVLNVVAQLTPESMGVEGGGLYGEMAHSAQNAAVAIETIEREAKEG